MNKKEQDYLKKKVNLLTDLLNSKKYTKLVEEGTLLKKKYPDIYLISNAIGLGYHGLGENNKAFEILENALAKNPDNIFILNNLGLVLSALNKNALAEKYLNKALELKPDYLNASVTLANLKMKENKYDSAIKLLTKNYNSNENNYVLNFNLANAYQESGDFENAKKYHEVCLKKFPGQTGSDKSISAMTKYTKDHPHLLSMEKKINEFKNLDKQNLTSLNFALGKAFEDIKDFDKSFKYLKAGNDLKNNSLDYDINQEEKDFKYIKERLSLKNLESEKSKPNLIFIVGMPRSGTTLVEQILSSHNHVYGAGELNYMNEIIETHIIKKGKEICKSISKEDISKFKNIYLENIRIYKSSKDYFVDKALLNFKWIGLLVNMFPNAKIINCTRDPLDTCISNYKNSFASSRLDFCYDLKNLGMYFKLYENLMIHWNKLYPEKILNFNYEELTANPDMKTKDLLKFCGLKWDENCLSFFKNKRAVSTASYVQIRSPIYKSSVKSWMRYKNHIGTLLEIFGEEIR